MNKLLILTFCVCLLFFYQLNSEKDLQLNAPHSF